MTVTTDVLVVGAGPAGLTMSALLAQYGIDALTVTQYPSTANSPRAHITNQRTMEVMRDLGAEERVKDVSLPNDAMRNNVWATSFSGTEIARLEAWGSGQARNHDYRNASPCTPRNVPQHILEPVLLGHARQLGADIWFNSKLMDIWQDDTGVTAVVRDRNTEGETTIRARYVVGADGGRSTVAQELGFEFEGETGLGAAVNIWLEADLTAYCQHGPGVLYWMAQPGNDYWVGSGTWINVKPFTEWVLLCMYDPDEGEPDLSDEALIARAQQTIGDPEVEVRIKAASTWQINRVVATSYQRGRAFLAGDAAHRHAPANGLGTNTSIQDSYNLAWKLAMVLKGQADASLLDTYDAERQPVGERVVHRAWKSVQDMGVISEALGFRPGQSSAEGWASLDELFSAADGAAQRRQQLAEAIELQNYQFNAHGMDMGQYYDSAAVIDGSMTPPDTGLDQDLYYVPSVTPGAVIPHAWVQRGTDRVSTLDLVGQGRFTLVTGIDDAAWRHAAEDVAVQLGVDLIVEQVGVRCQNDDVLNAWTQLREVSDSGALLVRPDRHLAWRIDKLPEDPTAALRGALQTVLGRHHVPITV
ncbi:MAG TPA: FAD-dependent monooxygenase [Enteractinococcus sp.]